MSGVRTHFCTLVASRKGGTCWPRKYGLNGCMPAFTSSRVGSSAIRLADGTTVCPCCSKKVRKRRTISADSIGAILHKVCGRHGRWPGGPGGSARPAGPLWTFEGRGPVAGLSLHIKLHPLPHVTGQPGQSLGPGRRGDRAGERGQPPVAGHAEDGAEGDPEQPPDHDPAWPRRVVSAGRGRVAAAGRGSSRAR